MICSFLKICYNDKYKVPHSVCDDVTVKAVEEVCSNCRWEKMRLQLETNVKFTDYVSSHLLSLVVS